MSIHLKGTLQVAITLIATISLLSLSDAVTSWWRSIDYGVEAMTKQSRFLDFAWLSVKPITFIVHVVEPFLPVFCLPPQIVTQTQCKYYLVCVSVSQQNDLYSDKNGIGNGFDRTGHDSCLFEGGCWWNYCYSALTSLFINHVTNNIERYISLTCHCL